MQHSHRSDARGGGPYPLENEFNLYFFHVNKTGTDKFSLHVAL